MSLYFHFPPFEEIHDSTVSKVFFSSFFLHFSFFNVHAKTKMTGKLIINNNSVENDFLSRGKFRKDDVFFSSFNIHVLEAYISIISSGNFADIGDS